MLGATPYRRVVGAATCTFAHCLLLVGQACQQSAWHNSPRACLHTLECVGLDRVRNLSLFPKDWELLEVQALINQNNFKYVCGFFPSLSLRSALLGHTQSEKSTSEMCGKVEVMCIFFPGRSQLGTGSQVTSDFGNGEFAGHSRRGSHTASRALPLRNPPPPNGGLRGLLTGQTWP